VTGSRFSVFLCLTLAFSGGSAVAQVAPAPDAPAESEAEDPRQAERLRLHQQVKALLAAGKMDEVVTTLEKALSLAREIYGDHHEEVADTVEMLAMVEEHLGDLDASRKWREESLRLRAAIHGDEHWKTMEARASLNDIVLRSELSDEDRERLARAELLNSAVYRLWRAGRYAEAIPKAKEALEARLALLGEHHLDTAVSLYNLAAQHQGLGDLQAAVPLLRRAAGILESVFGRDHPQCAQGLAGLAALHYQMGGYSKAKPLYLRALEIYRDTEGEVTDSYVTALSNYAVLLLKMGDLRAAEPVCRRAVEICREVHGDRHPSYATTIGNLALLHQEKQEFEEAEPLYRRALDIMREAFGEEHPGTLSVRTGLGTMYSAMGEYAAAERIFREVLTAGRKVYGTGHPTLATMLNDLANIHFSRGEYSRAERLYREAAEIRGKALGEAHPDYAESLNNLGTFYLATGEYARAGPLFRRALDIRGRALGEANWEVACSLNNLALLYMREKKFAAAEPLLRKALGILRETLGEEHAHCSLTLSNLANIRTAMGDHDGALAAFQQALAIRRRALGERHPEVALGLHNLAVCYEQKGDRAAAEIHFRQALDVWKASVGEAHDSYASSLAHLALLRHRQGEPAEAAALCRQAVGIRQTVLDATASVQSERQQLKMSRHFRATLDAYLILAERSDVAVAEVYAPVLAWKGAIHARQALNRIPRANPDVAGLFAEFDRTSRRLATLALSVPSPEGREVRLQRIRELTEEKEKLGRELSLRSEAYRELAAAGVLSPSGLQERLPPGTVLVDFLEYAWAPLTGESTSRKELRLLAFLVPSSGEIQRVELGPASRVAEAVAAWRETVSRRGTGREAGERLRELVWDPLRAHLSGAKTVLVSPDGALNRIPMAALPGAEPGAWLIEEVAMALIPVPQRLPALLAQPLTEDEARSLLLVGGVDYGSAPGASADPVGSRIAAGTRADTLHGFASLPATKEEVEAIGTAFARRHDEGRVVVSRGSEATESAFREHAPGRSWLHLATHGYFASPEVRSALAEADESVRFGGHESVAGYHPGLLSGLAFAGANSPPEADGDDGILTATEVASMDLSGVEAAVLSACETGLGAVAGGEGVLGLQRAFQVAGARTTVTSLWSVPDRATRVLMERFYENLWERKLPKLEALREAQLWMLNEGGATEDARRGLGLPARTEEADGGIRLPPYYWAGWVLAGDWR
jgi:CHAT domain-containing protein/tetratricopeptide (TPR) repeat protein